MESKEPDRSIKQAKSSGGKPSRTHNQNKTRLTKKEQQKRRTQKRWVLTAFVLSFLITAVLSLGSTEVVASINVLVAIPVLLFFIFIGVFFDILGLAVAVAEVKPFNSMAARKLKSGKKAVWLISNSDKVTSFCNDLIGDIAGVMSGVTGAAISVNVFDSNLWLTLLLTSLIAAATVGFKAVGKIIATKHSEGIVLFAAKVLSGFSDKPGKPTKNEDKIN